MVEHTHLFFNKGYQVYPVYGAGAYIPVVYLHRATVMVEGRICTKHRYAGVREGEWLVVPATVTAITGFRSDEATWIDVVWSADEAAFYAKLAQHRLPVPVRLRHVKKLADLCGEPARSELQALLWTEAAASLA